MADTLRWLQLLQIADSALPIGSTAHSYGLEMLAADGLIGGVETLRPFFADYLSEVGALEAAYCGSIHQVAAGPLSAILDVWGTLNLRLDALKMARETRQASATLGRRFLSLVNQLEPHAVITAVLDYAAREAVSCHHAMAFGLVGGLFSVERSLVVGAYLHQNIAGLISACQRLLPLGQNGASKLLWDLKPIIAEIAAREPVDMDIPVSTPLLEVESQRHPTLTTRLFIS